MKSTFFAVATLLISFTLKAQDNELNNAYGFINAHLPDKAKVAIDKATVNEKTKDLAKTWAFRGFIYSSLAADSSRSSSSDKNLTVAQEAIARAKELDKKGEFKQDIENSRRNLAQLFVSRGIKQFNAKDYKAATSSFKFVSDVLPADTTWMLNTAVSAYNAQDYDQANSVL